jgi:hypothetical protein
VLAYAQACQLSPPGATQIVRSDCVDPDLLKRGRDLATLRVMSFGLTRIGALSLPRIDAALQELPILERSCSCLRKTDRREDPRDIRLLRPFSLKRNSQYFALLMPIRRPKMSRLVAPGRSAAICVDVSLPSDALVDIPLFWQCVRWVALTLYDLLSYGIQRFRQWRARSTSTP